LPPFPEPEYGYAEKPFRTIAQVINRIPKKATRNNPKIDAMPRTGDPYSPHQALPFCITRTGGKSRRRKNYHPNGKRDFTIREYASMQGFPMKFEFASQYTTVKKPLKKKKASVRQTIGMIGDSVPPKYSKQIYAEVIKTLMGTDGRLSPVSRPLFDNPILSPTNRAVLLPPPKSLDLLVNAASNTPPKTKETPNPTSSKRSRQLSSNPLPQKRRARPAQDTFRVDGTFEDPMDIEMKENYEGKKSNRTSKVASRVKIPTKKTTKRPLQTMKSPSSASGTVDDPIELDDDSDTN
jgi:hypothetical protein